jgi:hypothetical protein
MLELDKTLAKNILSNPIFVNENFGLTLKVSEGARKFEIDTNFIKVLDCGVCNELFDECFFKDGLICKNNIHNTLKEMPNNLEKVYYSINTEIVNVDEGETIVANVCNRCYAEVKNFKKPIKKFGLIPKFSKYNGFEEISYAKELADLTWMEENLIRIVQPLQNIFSNGSNSSYSQGNIYYLDRTEELLKIAKVLPHLPKDVDIFVLREKNNKKTWKDFLCRRDVVAKALNYLQKNNPAYHDILISEDNLSELPTEGFIKVATKMIDSSLNNASKKADTDLGPAPDQQGNIAYSI